MSFAHTSSKVCGFVFAQTPCWLQSHYYLWMYFFLKKKQMPAFFGPQTAPAARNQNQMCHENCVSQQRSRDIPMQTKVYVCVCVCHVVGREEVLLKRRAPAYCTAHPHPRAGRNFTWTTADRPTDRPEPGWTQRTRLWMDSTRPRRRKRISAVG